MFFDTGWVEFAPLDQVGYAAGPEVVNVVALAWEVYAQEGGRGDHGLVGEEG